MCFELNDENSFILKPNEDASADTEGLLNTAFDCGTDKLPNEIQMSEVCAPNKLDDFSGIEDVCIDGEIAGNSSDTNEEEILEKEERETFEVKLRSRMRNDNFPNFEPFKNYAKHGELAGRKHEKEVIEKNQKGRIQKCPFCCLNGANNPDCCETNV